MTTKNSKAPCFHIRRLPLIGLAFAVLLVGCGGESPERARAQLAKLNLSYSPDDFIKSIETGDKLAIRHFLAAGMKVDVVNRKNEVPLLVAAYKGHTEIARILVDAGAADKGALVRAAMNGHLDTVKLLVKRGWDVRLQTPVTKSTALSVAAGKGHVEVVAYLLENGADPNQSDLEHGSVLHIAVHFLQPKIVELLIRAGAKLDALNGNGENALALAKWRLDHAGMDGANRAAEEKRAEQIIGLLNNASGNRKAG